MLKWFGKLLVCNERVINNRHHLIRQWCMGSAVAAAVATIVILMLLLRRVGTLVRRIIADMLSVAACRKKMPLHGMGTLTDAINGNREHDQQQ
ncbi:MAG: hypothetical protein HXX17_13985 [Geobacteraceae bacterium]|nr:hypothetical protein [Geobacteraceae bacterium]